MVRPVQNPPNPWAQTHVDLGVAPPDARLEVYEEEAKSVVSRNESPDVPFTFSINPYRGCHHGCAYCYARPTHEYLGFGAGTDFERRIVVKTNAAALLEDALRKGTTRGEVLAFSGVTDCYQPLEASYRLTRRCLAVCARFEQPVGIITKGALVERDIDLLSELGRVARASVFLSIPFADDAMAQRIEPFAPTPTRRLRALAALAEAGIDCGVAVAPIIPGLNDDQIPRILRAARDAGARRAFPILLRLPGNVRAVFAERLHEREPLRAERVLRSTAAARGGDDAGQHRFGKRMVGSGPRWDAVRQLFALECARLGYSTADERRSMPEPRPARRPRQRGLFGDD